MRKALEKTADRLIGLSAMIGTVGLIFVVTVIVADVIGRNFGRPIYGSQDMIIMTMVLIVFGGMALCDRKDGHIVVDIFEPFFPPVMNRIINIFSALLGGVIFILIAFTVFKSAQLSQMLNMSTNLLRLPTAWFQFALCGLSIVAALTMFLRLFTLIMRSPEETHSEQDRL